MTRLRIVPATLHGRCAAHRDLSLGGAKPRLTWPPPLDTLHPSSHRAHLGTLFTTDS